MHLKTTAGFSLSTRWGYAILILTILFFAAIRYRLRDVPLERDEGEFAYIGQIILRGIPPFHAGDGGYCISSGLQTF